MGAEAPAGLLSFLSLPFQGLLIFALYLMSWLLSVLIGRNKEEYVYSVFPEVQVLFVLLWFLRGEESGLAAAGNHPLERGGCSSQV